MPEVNRRQIIKTVGTASIAGLAGCSSSGSSGNGSTGGGSSAGSKSGGNGGSQQTVDITYRDREDTFTAMAKAFNKSQSGVHVNPSIKPEKSKYRSLIAQITAGNAPEVIGLDVVYLPRFAELGALADLSSYYKNASYTSDIFDPLKKDFIRWNDKVYAMPYWIDCSLYIYNKQHYKKAGLDPESPPATWGDFKDACAKLKSAGYTPLSNTLGLLGLEVFFFMPFVWANGGKLFNDNKTKCLIDQQPAVEALQFFKDLSDKGYTTDQTQNQHFTFPPFESGKASMAFSSSGIGAIKKQSPDVYKNMGTAMFPKPEGGHHSSFLGGDCIVISQQTKKKADKFKDSKKYIDWIHSDTGMNTMVSQTGYLPSRKSGFQGKYLKNHQDIYSAFEKALKNGHAPPMHPKLNQMQSPLNNALTRAIKGQQSPQAALSQAAKSIDKVLQS